MNLEFDLSNANPTLSFDDDMPPTVQKLNKDEMIARYIQKLTPKEKLLHEKAIRTAKKFKSAHTELIDIVIELDRARLSQKFELKSTFSYCSEVLGLTKDIICTLTKVARASEKVPELKTALDLGEMSITNAREIAAIVTQENKIEWIEKAKTLTQEKLQREVAKVFPKEAVKEKAKYVSAERIKLEMGVDEDLMKLFRQAQDLVSQKTRKAASLEDTLIVVLENFVGRYDPLKKAERAQDRKVKRDEKTKEVSKMNVKYETKEGHKVHENSRAVRRLDQKNAANKEIGEKKTPAHILHAVNLRDQRQCQERKPDGTICGSQRWLDYHHIIPRYAGGEDTLENLITLCSFHHRKRHE